MFCVVLELLSSIYGCFKGHARCLPCSALACTKCCLLLLECALIIPCEVARSQSDVRVGELWGMLGKAGLGFWARWRLSERTDQIQSCLPFNESQVYKLCKPNTCRLWKARRKGRGPVWRDAFCRGKFARSFFPQKEGGRPYQLGDPGGSLSTGPGLCPTLL